jgi:hypothetical protein
MKRITVLCTLAAFALAFAATDGAATEPATLVVDRDGVECANAGYTSIQAAVDAAEPGDLIRVCPDLYTETVVVDKPLTLKADPDAVEAIGCFQPTLGELPADQQAIVDPADDGFAIAFTLEADDIVLEGFVIEGASVGVDAGDRFSGYRVHHNLIQENTLFGMDFGSEGTRESRVDHNCIRENEFGLVSELDDDRLWPDLGNRGPGNARDLVNARIDHNDTTWNIEGIATAGPGRRVEVTIAGNRSRGDQVGIGFQNSTSSAIVDNEVTEAGSNAIVIGGGNDGLLIAANRVRGAGTFGLLFVETFIDRFAIPSRDVVVARNELTQSQAGIRSNPNNLAQSSMLENTTSENRVNGIVLVGTSGNVIHGNHTDNNGVNGIALLSGSRSNVIGANQADNNGTAGITAALGATGNRFEQNSMHGNVLFDARDLNPLVNGMLQNVWTGNDCLTDFPAGKICGVG